MDLKPSIDRTLVDENIARKDLAAVSYQTRTGQNALLY